MRDGTDWRSPSRARAHHECLLQVAITRCCDPQRDAGFRVAHRRALTSVEVSSGPEYFLSERAREFVLTNQAIAVHRVEIELGGVHHEVVVQVLGVRHPFEQAPPLVQGHLDLPAVSEPRPCLGFLACELHRHAVIWRHLTSGLRCRDHAAVVTGREREPCPHLVRPSGDLCMVGFRRKRESRAPCRLGSVPVSHVVLDTADPEGEPAGQGEYLAVLGKREALRVEFDDASQPLAPLDDELPAGHVRVLRAQPIRGDPQSIERGAVDIGPVQSAHDLQRLHAARRQDLPVSVSPRWRREERVRHGAEPGRDDRPVAVLNALLQERLRARR